MKSTNWNTGRYLIGVAVATLTLGCGTATPTDDAQIGTRSQAVTSCGTAVPWDAAKPWYDYSVGEYYTHAGTTWKVVNPAWAYVEPGTANSSYGWVEETCSTCTPTTCSAESAVCGTIDDGCGSTLNCGTCSGDDTCGATNQCEPPVTCTTTTCAAEGANCGTIDDGCGGTLTCGTCGTNEACTGNVCVATCTPTTCAAEGAACGTIDDGCGGTLTCGTCPTGESCNGSNLCETSGGGGSCTAPAWQSGSSYSGGATVSKNGFEYTANWWTQDDPETNSGPTGSGKPWAEGVACGGGGGTCTPTTCAAEGAACGTIDDGCGGTLTCGSCAAGEACNGANVCEATCTPTTCAAEGAACGTIDDGCGGTLTCGTCSAGDTCDSTNQCVTSCTPTTCAAAGATCGTIDDGCGGTLTCGSCSAGETCSAGNQCVATCTPTTCAAAGAVCGTIPDGCGGTLACGTCSAGETCNGSNQCDASCTVTTCAAAGATCGTVPDGCGGTLTCGTCGTGDTCNGSNQCEATGSTPCSANEDCPVSHLCSATGFCKVSTCSDSVNNQDETGVDCGGSSCPACTDGRTCLTNSDCISGVCKGANAGIFVKGICGDNCADGVQNQDESDVDCGGSCGNTCFNGKSCTTDGDCVSLNCNTTTNTCEAPGAGGSACNCTDTQICYPVGGTPTCISEVTGDPNVDAVLLSGHAAYDAAIMLDQEGNPSQLYKWHDLLVATRSMALSGIGGTKLYTAEGETNATKKALYTLVNMAALLGQSMQETIQYDACDENNWDLKADNPALPHDYPVSSACGQLNQVYANYAHECPDACEQRGDLMASATTNAKWYGAPGPLFSAPDAKLHAAGLLKDGKTGKWDYGTPWCEPGVHTSNPDEHIWERNTCEAYEGQQAGMYTNNGESRTGVQGCVWWGRGVIQTTGPCNFGKLNKAIGKGAGANALYDDIDFCRNPESLCQDNGHPELKWIAGYSYWMSEVQSSVFPAFSYDHIQALKAYVDGGCTGTAYIDSVSGIVNRGCPSLTSCVSGPVHEASHRRTNFNKVLTAMGINDCAL